MQVIRSNLSKLYTNTFWVGNNNWDVKIHLAPLSVKFPSIHLILNSQFFSFPTPSIFFSFLIQFISSLSATLSVSIFVSLTLEMAMVSGNRAEREGG